MKRKDPFKNRAITLFVYNLGEVKDFLKDCTREEKMRHFGLDPYDGEILDTLPKINFLKFLKLHFGEIKKEWNHCDIIRDDYRIYYYHNNGVETNFTELMVAGKQAIVEILELGRKHNWAVISPGRNELIDLSSLPSYGYLNLEEYFGDE
jgi:hypothetical protein